MAAANKPPGSANGRSAGKPGPKGTATEKYRRDLAILGARLQGRSAAALAREHGLSERQVREVVSHMRDVVELPHDASPEEVIDRVLLAMEDALAEMARAAYELSGAARLRGLGTYLRGIRVYVDVLGRAGCLPDPNRASVERDAERMVAVVLDVFRRYGVPMEAQREIHDLLVGRGRAQEPG